MGTFWLPFLGHTWRLLGRRALSGERVLSGMGQGSELQVYSFQQIGADYAFISILGVCVTSLTCTWQGGRWLPTAPLAGEPHALHHRSSLCTSPVYQKTKAQHLPSRSSGLMRERHMTNLSAALQCVQKVCSKEKGATHFVWQVSEGTFRKVETWGKAAQTE